jgi:hypothetical protein
MARLLLLCGGDRDLRELAAIGANRAHVIMRHDYATDALEQMISPSPQRSAIRTPAAEIEAIVAAFGPRRIDGVVSTDDYPGSTLASIVARRLELRGPDPLADLTCQHKYLSRLAQQAAVPDAVPWFLPIGRDPRAVPCDRIEFPAFVKPVKSFFSIGARRVDSPAELQQALIANPVIDAFLEPLDALLRDYAGRSVGAPLLVEGLLTGRQATLDGFACGGQVAALGVVDSLFFPGTLSFERFEYPSTLPVAVQDAMAGIACRMMKAISFDNGLFNIEFMHDPQSGALSIIEINPRMSSQFADLYEKVDGFNPYQVMLDLALGREPSLRRRRGRHAMAASCVMRTFSDCEVRRVASPADLGAALARWPDARIEILATPGRRLSHAMQDGASFRYGLINIGGNDRQDILSTFDACRRALPFELVPLDPRGALHPRVKRRLALPSQLFPASLRATR